MTHFSHNLAVEENFTASTFLSLPVLFRADNLVQIIFEEILDVPPGEVCVQWVWDNVHDAEGVASAGAALGNGQGLHPMRTAFVLLGTPAVGDEDHDGTNGSSSGLHPPPIAMSRVTASRAEDLRRRASQLKVAVATF